MSATDSRAASKRYSSGSPYAVKDLNLLCHKGEMLALLGPSGCDKSSTLKMAAGLEYLSEGEIFFDGLPVSGLPAGRRNIAIVFEDYCLYSNLTVEENVAFPLSVCGGNAEDNRRKVAEVLAILDLQDLAARAVSGLSGGVQQRVALGRAIVRRPDLILFAEPLSHLDGDQRIHLRAQISQLQKARGLTSILVIHDQNEATAMADKVTIMNYGVLQQVDTPKRLYARPANTFVANFTGEPPMNLIDAKMGKGAASIFIPSLDSEVAMDGQRRKLLSGRLFRSTLWWLIYASPRRWTAKKGFIACSQRASCQGTGSPGIGLSSVVAIVDTWGVRKCRSANISTTKMRWKRSFLPYFAGNRASGG